VLISIHQAASNNNDSLAELTREVVEKTDIIQSVDASKRPRIAARMQKLAKYDVAFSFCL
jgi:hypothetical protein